MRRAFSLVELMTCIAILLVVAAISFPVFGAAKRWSRRSAAVSNLHQLYLAVALYRSEQGGDGIYGDPAAMGIPTDSDAFPSPYDRFIKPIENLTLSPCGLNTSWYRKESWEVSGPVEDVTYRPNDRASYAAYSRVYRDNSLLFYDVNCDDPGTPIYNPYFVHRGLAVLLEGQLVQLYKPGIMLGNDAWWSTPGG